MTEEIEVQTEQKLLQQLENPVLSERDISLIEQKLAIIKKHKS